MYLKKKKTHGQQTLQNPETQTQPKKLNPEAHAPFQKNNFTDLIH